MKKLFSLMLVAVLLLSVAVAETVFVTISDDQGNIVLANEAFDVSDSDGDGVISIADALFAAHEAKFEGGVEAGFAAADMGYGLSLTRLWGVENGGSYGYYVNNASAMSLADAVAEGDDVYAYVYTDLETWSDTYAYFDTIRAVNSGELNLTLNAVTFDADYNPVSVPVEGAIITIDGEDTEFVTDAEGKVSIQLGEGNDFLISARSDSMTLVPPICVVSGSAR